VVILQDDRFDGTASITICAFTTDPTDAPLFRLPVVPSDGNGLRVSCRLMVDKITTVVRCPNRDHAIPVAPVVWDHPGWARDLTAVQKATSR
jgi:mRNA-degrading endonuclease toxin of MazEF toxin-antitoxin module